MHTIRFYVGTRYDKNGKRLSRLAEKQEQAQVSLLDTFGGCTSYKAQGAWKNAQGDTVQEPSIVYEVTGTLSKRAAVFTARQLKKIYNQESVLMTRENVSSSFL